MVATGVQIKTVDSRIAMSPDLNGKVSTTRLVLAFACIYFIWGSTFLAIRYAIETIPPFLMAAARFLTAGFVLYAWVRIRKVPKPTLAHWGIAFFIGGLLFLCGNGAVVWSEQRIPSGMASLLMATIPLWMVLLDSLQQRSRPGVRVILGLCLGFAGVIILSARRNLTGNAHAELAATIVSVLGAFCWALGSIYSRRALLPPSMLLATAMEMIGGGFLLMIAGLAAGEWGQFHVSAISTRSLLSLVYLTFFGSLLSFSAYIWLLKVTAPGHVATYAYVNPMIAVFLGWLIAGEPVTIRLLLAAAVILFAVVLITVYAKRRPIRTSS